MPIPVECRCGCGQMIVRSFRNGRHIVFKPGHHRVVDGKPQRGRPFTCKQCGLEGIQAKSNRVYCSVACYWKARGFSSVPNTRKLGSGQYADRSIFRVSRSPRIQRIYMRAQVNACEQCGWSECREILELHHVNQDHKDGRRENLKLLCPNCHQLYHYKTETGQFDKNRFKKVKKIKEALGITAIPRGLGRTALQDILDRNPGLIN